MKVTLEQGAMVRFHTPLADENPTHRYILLSNPSVIEERAEFLRRHGCEKYRAMAQIQLICDLPFKPIHTVPLDDLCAC